ncbi:MAG: ankyrin repeat domain-containing protein [Acidiferrobacterales bacterium]
MPLRLPLGAARPWQRWLTQGERRARAPSTTTTSSRRRSGQTPISKPGLFAISARGAGDTPVHVAAYYGQTAMVELLIAEGAKINPGNYDGYSALRLAAQQGQQDMVELLKRHGAKE